MRSEPWGRPMFAAQGPATGKEGWLRGSAQGSRRSGKVGCSRRSVWALGSWLSHSAGGEPLGIPEQRNDMI